MHHENDKTNMIVTIFTKEREKHDIFLNKNYVVSIEPLGESECYYRGVDALCDIEMHNGTHLIAQGSLEELVQSM